MLINIIRTQTAGVMKNPDVCVSLCPCFTLQIRLVLQRETGPDLRGGSGSLILTFGPLREGRTCCGQDVSMPSPRNHHWAQTSSFLSSGSSAVRDLHATIDSAHKESNLSLCPSDSVLGVSYHKPAARLILCSQLSRFSDVPHLISSFCVFVAVCTG